MINAIIADYKNELFKSYTDAYGTNWDYLSLEVEVSSFLEQLCFSYKRNQIVDLYNLL